jgi:hypothetical protein
MKYQLKINQVVFIEIDINNMSSEDYIVIHRLMKEHWKTFFHEDVNQKVILAYEAFFYFLSIEDYRSCDYIKKRLKRIVSDIVFNRIYGKQR